MTPREVPGRARRPFGLVRDDVAPAIGGCGIAERMEIDDAQPGNLRPAARMRERAERGRRATVQQRDLLRDRGVGDGELRGAHHADAVRPSGELARRILAHDCKLGRRRKTGDHQPRGELDARHVGPVAAGARDELCRGGRGRGGVARK
jgi:hypothetical protein